MRCEEVWILGCYNLLKSSNYNFPAVFGLAYVDLPLYVAEDIKALTRRDAQVKARKKGKK